MIIEELIINKGNPKAWFDPQDKNQSSFGVWDFDEKIVFTSSGCYLNDLRISGDPINALQNCINRWKKESDFISAVGFFSYDFKKFLYSHIQFKQTIEDNIPYFWFGKPKEVYQIENKNIYSPENIGIKPKEETISYDIFKTQIGRIKFHLAKGDVYQINYTYPQIFNSEVNPFDLYLKLRQSAQPQFGWFLDLEIFQILSFSPERFFRVSDGNIYSYPIKGTRPRSVDIDRDEQLAEELFHSEKDRAEHLMIVDLLRNDLGKVCNFGSIKVNDLYKVESYETVHHLVTEITGNLKYNIQEMDIINALFPGGSITGAPKERAMQIIDSLENYSRGIYTGSIGYITSSGKMDFNIAIRTLTIQGRTATYPVGGGIVWDSIPEEEWKETNTKSEILKNVLINNNKLEALTNGK